MVGHESGSQGQILPSLEPFSVRKGDVVVALLDDLVFFSFFGS